MSASRTAVVTGGMSGLGAATATRLAADGVKFINWTSPTAPTYTSTSPTRPLCELPRNRPAPSTS